MRVDIQVQAQVMLCCFHNMSILLGMIDAGMMTLNAKDHDEDR